MVRTLLSSESQCWGADQNNWPFSSYSAVLLHHNIQQSEKSASLLLHKSQHHPNSGISSKCHKSMWLISVIRAFFLRLSGHSLVLSEAILGKRQWFDLSVVQNDCFFGNLPDASLSLHEEVWAFESFLPIVTIHRITESQNVRGWKGTLWVI